MLTICQMPPKTMRKIQEKEGAYYWSALAANILRSLGCISVRSAEFQRAESTKGQTLLITRLSEGEFFDWTQPVVVEAPISGTVEKVLGLDSGKVIHVDEFWMVTPGGKELGRVCRQRVMIKGTDGRTVPAAGSESSWRAPTIPLLHVSLLSGWDVMLEARLANGERMPLVLAREATLLLTAPLFDVMGGWLGFPPLSARFAGIAAGLAPVGPLRAVASAIRQFHLERADMPWVEVAPFPSPYSAALTVRHDYDRPISDAHWEDLLTCYDQIGIRATIGILPYLMPFAQIEQIQKRGHEIQLHCTGHEEIDVRQQLEALRHVAGKTIFGATIHGGPAGIGFRGDIHFGFFETCNLGYAETFGIKEVPATPLARIVDGVPTACMHLVAPPSHFSLDGSTRPDDHRLDNLKRLVPKALARGEYVIVMNHPDIHRPQLLELLSTLDMKRVWRAPVREVVDFRRNTALASLLQSTQSTVKILFENPLSEPASLTIYRRDSRRNVQLPAGADSLLVDF